MKKKKRSFFEKITGAVKVDDFDEFDFDEQENEEDTYPQQMSDDRYEESQLPAEEGELSVDVLNNDEEIIIKAMVAGVKPQDLDIQITRDMVTIHGTREEEIEVKQEDYFHKELYWGSFARNIILPEEVDVEAAEAKEKHGLLIIKLPKIDKNRKTKLSVKTS
jgi:HSP20 family molecular chaperone IbpA